MGDVLNRPFQRSPIYYCARGETLTWEDLNGETLQAIADEIGIEKTLELCVYFGGIRLYIPKVLLDSHPIMVLGRKAAFKLCRMFGPARVEIPICGLSDKALKRLVTARIKAGESNSKVALALGLSWRTVTRFIDPSQKNRQTKFVRHRGRPVNSDGHLTLAGEDLAINTNHTTKNETNAPVAFLEGNNSHGKKELSHV